MTRVLRILAALLLLAALLGAEGSGCERVETNRRPQDRQVDPAQRRVANIDATSTGPYSVLVITTDNITGVERAGPNRYAPGEKFHAEVPYETGAKVEIKIRVYGHRQDEMQCTITDGPARPVHGSHKGEAICLLTTSQ